MANPCPFRVFVLSCSNPPFQKIGKIAKNANAATAFTMGWMPTPLRRPPAWAFLKG
jgi:hypothetical protein